MGKGVARRKASAVFFDDEDLDFYLMMALANAGAGGAEYGECFWASSRVRENDPESWVSAWGALAGRLEARAEEALRTGRRVSAREAWMRAYTYHRVASVLLRIGDPRYRQTWERARSCFRGAASLLDPPVETVSVGHGGWNLPGYFVRAGGGEEDRPTVVFATGGEGWAEDGYFWIGAAGARRGYNMIAVDLPFHVGGRLQNPGLRIGSLEEAVDGPMGAVVDRARGLPGVDPQRVAVFGFSAGGTFAARASARNASIAACVSDSPIRDMRELFSEELPGALRRMPAFVADALARVANRRNRAAAVVLERTCWQAGVRNVSEFLEVIRPLTIEAKEIRCPMLCLASSGEGPGFVRQAREVYEALPGPKGLRVFTAEEGADAHCQVNNLSLMQQVAYDWLAEVLGSRVAGASR